MTIYEGQNYVSSPFGPRTNPITGKPNAPHYGKDSVGQQSKRQRLVVPRGKVLAVNPGYQGGRGTNVVIQSIDDAHCPGIDVRLRYQHQASTPLRVGQVLAMGDLVGIEGSTGDSTGSHCHFEVTVNGVAVDPSPWDGLPNIKGAYPGNNDNPYQKEATDKMYCFDVTAGGKLELFTSADVTKVAKDAKGLSRKLPTGKSILLKEVTLANLQAGFSNKGVYIELEGTRERLYAASGLGGCEIVQNDTAEVLSRFYPDKGAGGVPQADYDAVVEDRNAQKAAKEAALKVVSACLADAKRIVKTLGG